MTERDLTAVAKGQTAAVRARTFPDRVFTGAVSRINPHLAMGMEPDTYDVVLFGPAGRSVFAQYRGGRGA